MTRVAFIVTLCGSLLGLTTAFVPSPTRTTVAVRSSSSTQCALPPLLDLYATCLEQHTLPTQALTASGFAGVGDVLAQKKTRPQASYQCHRTVQYMVKGLGSGLIWSVWYGHADGVANSLAHTLFGEYQNHQGLILNDTILRIALSMLLEQFLLCPIVYSLYDIPVPLLLHGGKQTIPQLPSIIKTKLGPLLWANAKVWTPANLITYSLPADLRMLFCSLTDIVWQGVLSHMTTTNNNDQSSIPVTTTPPTTTTTVWWWKRHPPSSVAPPPTSPLGPA